MLLATLVGLEIPHAHHAVLVATYQVNLYDDNNDDDDNETMSFKSYENVVEK